MPAPDPADRIKARTDADARARYLHFLQRSLSAFCTISQWHTLPVERLQDVHAAYTVPTVVPLKTVTGGRIYLRASQRFAYEDVPTGWGRKGERKVSTREYAYTLAENEDLSGQICSWEWQPAVDDAWEEPHVHVLRGRPEAKGLGKLHIPTGRVAYEQVLWFAMTDHGAAPVSDEALWRLRDSLRRFQAFKTW